MTGDIDRIRRNWARAMQSGRHHIMVDLETAAELISAADRLRELQGQVIPFRVRVRQKEANA